jgi:type VI secretion system secreted protein VgrG
MAWTQADRPFRLETPLGPDALLLVRWAGEERISAPFRFVAVAWSPRADIEAAELLLKPVTLRLRLPSGQDRTIPGVVSRLVRGGIAAPGHTEYTLEIVPPHWVLSLDEGFALFQDRTVREVADALLQGIDHEWKLVRTLEPRPYCVRYRESRWSCVARLLEQEGIWYRMDHRGSAAKLVLGDNTASAQPAWGLETLEFNPGADDLLSELTVHAAPFVAETRVRSASEFLAGKDVADVVRASGAFTPPRDVAAYVFDQQIGAHRTGITHTGGDSPGDAAKLARDTAVYARLRQEQAEALSVLVEGRSRYLGLETGARVTVSGHPAASMNRGLFVLTVRHGGANGSYLAGDQSGFAYENEFEAIPAGVPYRPPRSIPWPRVGGAHAATVVGPPGEEIYTDKHGRVQVVFHWDADHSRALTHSCFVRVAQPFAGQQFGAVFLPRVGHEVLVEFLDGNPDNPVVVGSLYNAANLPPWALPAKRTQSGVRTRSTPAGGADNHNELRFEDKKGAEQLFVQAERDLDTVVKRNETRRVGADRTTTIHANDARTVEEGDDTTVVAKGTQSITVGEGSRTLSVKKDHTVTVEGAEAVTVEKKRTVTVRGGQQHTVTGDDRTGVTGGKSVLTVAGDREVTASQGGNITVTSANGKITLEAMQSITLKVGGSTVTIDPSGITIKGPMVKVQADANAEVKAGAMVTVKGNAMVQVSASGMLKLQGGVTMIN